MSERENAGPGFVPTIGIRASRFEAVSHNESATSVAVEAAAARCDTMKRRGEVSRLSVMASTAYVAGTQDVCGWRERSSAFVAEECQPCVAKEEEACTMVTGVNAPGQVSGGGDRRQRDRSSPWSWRRR